MLHIGEMLPRAGCDQKLAFAGKSSLETNINMKKQSKTNWDRIDSLKDSEIDYSDNPKLDADFFARAVRWPDNSTKNDSTGRQTAQRPRKKRER